MFRRLALIVVLLMLGCSAPPTTLVLVRHAEKQTGDDPALTERGEARAQALVAVASEALGGPPTAIYHTPFRRTRLTAQPAAEASGVRPVVFPVEGGAEEHARLLARAILQKEQGGRVLVVGHSNTVPLLLAEFGMEQPPEIPESRYDDLFVVVLRDGGEPEFQSLEYQP